MSTPVPLDSVVSCPHAPPCPGCPLLARSYSEQLATKHQQVRRIAGLFTELATTPVADARAADTVVEYRRRAKLATDGNAIGLFAHGTHDVVDIPNCRVLDPAISVVANAIRGLLPLSVPLRAVDLQRVDDGVLATLVVADGATEAAARTEATRLTSVAKEVTGVSVSFRDEASHQVLGRAPISLSGPNRVRSRVLADGPWHYVVAGGFAQAHQGQQRALFDAILGTVERVAGLQGTRVLELYSGSGALSLALAARGARVLSAESYAPAAELCRAAAEEQRLDVTVRAVDASVVARQLAAESSRVDVVIVNPPRRGLAPDVRADVAALAPSLVIYVSCEPMTLSRDLADLARRRLVPTSLLPYDMMPLTEEVETLAVLVPGKAPAPVVLHADDRLIAVVKSPHEPTTPQGEHASSLLARVRLLDGAEHAVPIHRLDLGTSGVCLFARRADLVAPLAKALAQGEKEYLALARGITRDKGSIRKPLLEQGKARPSRTRYRRLEVIGGHSLMSVLPDEGRKHQIRRHLAAIGHPVVGDERHGDPRTNRHFEMRHFLDRSFLHCARITLALPTGPLELSAPLAPDLTLVLETLRAKD